MVRGSLNKLLSRSLSVAGKWQNQQLRRLNIHEYQVRLDSFLTKTNRVSVDESVVPFLESVIYEIVDVYLTRSSFAYTDFLFSMKLGC